MTRYLSMAILTALVAAGVFTVTAVRAAHEGGTVKSVVPGRSVCSDACKARLDLANGVKPCPGCNAPCNVDHRWCRTCAAKSGACEVCGKSMVTRRQTSARRSSSTARMP
jgi:hypothetical protein